MAATAARRSRIALVTPVMPAEGGNGLAMRAGLLLEGLSLAGDVRVVIVPVFGGAIPGLDAAMCRHAASIQVLPLAADPDPVADLTARLATPQGRATAAAVHPRPALCQAATVDAAAEVLRGIGDVDLVVTFRLYMAPFLDAVFDSPRRPRLWLDIDEVESQTRRQLGLPGEAEAFRRLEAHYLPRFDLVTAASADEAGAVGGEYRLAAVAALPNAIRPPASPAASPGFPSAPSAPGGDSSDLLFVANLRYGPNEEGACWLAQEIMPRLGDVRLAIVGSGPRPVVQALADEPRITVAADVDSVTPWYAKTKVVVVPILAGGGTRTKVIEALAHRRAVVSTPLGAAGLPFDTTALLVAADADAFARACRRLLDHPDLAARLAADGEAAVLRTSTVAVVGRRIEALARHILSP